MRTRCILLIWLLYLLPGTAQTDRFSHTIVTIGNTADIRNVTEFASDLRDVLNTLGHRQTVLFNGDIIHDAITFEQAVYRVDTLIRILRDPGRRKLVFLPGDRDWGHSGEGGWQRAVRLESLIRNRQFDDVLWPVRHGCPGPEKITLDLTLNLIAVNTQWWNHPYDKPSPATADCDIATSEAAFEEMKSLIDDTGFGNIVIAGHFPIRSNGEYGGRFPWHRWLFPVPIVSSMVTSYRQNVGSPEETSNARFRGFREEMEDLLREYASIVYLSGHERNREVLRFDDNVMINSGAPVSGRFVARSHETLFASSEPGIILTQFDGNGNVWGSVFAYRDRSFRQESSLLLLQAPCTEPDKEVPINERLVPCLEEEYVLPEMSGNYAADTVLAANPAYSAKGFKKAILGEHYRATWTRPVRVPFLNLDTAYGGLIPYQVGGGRQTQSLKFVSENSEEYVFRSVDKDPSKALSYDLRETIVSLTVQDQTTTQHPYGALVASALLDHLDLLHARPSLFVMPDDEKLGPFRNQFGNMMGMIEERPTGRKEIQETFADADEIKQSISMFRMLYKDRDNFIDQQEFVRARMFDVLVGDWGKHEDNWKWAGYQTGKGLRFRPIPRDRDHVFSRWDGFLPWLADREWAKPSGENFDYEIKGLRSLMWQARHLDRFAANAATETDWIAAAAEIKSRLPDHVIDAAVQTLPEEVYAIDGPEIAAKLKQRRDDLDKYAREYYAMLAREVDVVGSVKNERFEVTRQPDGQVLVEMFKIRQGEKDIRFYTRQFDPEVTREIRLFGLQGDDEFIIAGEARESILIRVLPGQGEDRIVDESEVARGGKQTHIYDLDGTDSIRLGGEGKMVHIPYPEAYNYRRTGFQYNTYLPYAFVVFSSANGVQMGGGTIFSNRAYNKPGFSSEHALLGKVSTLGNLHFSYGGTWRHMVGKWDLTAGISLDDNRRFNYFFGLGNETTIDKDLFRDDFYSLQYSRVSADVGLARDFWDKSKFSLGIQMSSNSRESLEDNIYNGETTDVPGADPLRVGKLRMITELDFRDRIHLPTRGMRLYLEGYFAQVLNKSIDYSLAKATLESFTTYRILTLGLKGGATVHGGEPPYYDLHYLGQMTHLRGYRENRFAGKKSLFLNSDLRIQLVDKPSALVPHKIGLILFYDVGRVYVNGESSNKWHSGYGVGIYYVPLRERFALRLSAAFSEEESGLFKISFGQSF
ncbi:MAG: hypothetical protein R3301_00960 [Saprospiraceae bacterium]|nr:hypothetical protein [Saprospiraceae bacterium]